MKFIISIILSLMTYAIYAQCVTGTPPTLTCGTPITVASNTPSGQYGSASTGNPSCAISGDKITDADLYAVEYQPGKVIHIDMCLTIGNYVSVLSQDGCTELACENYGTSFALDNTACNGNRRTTISMDDLGLNPGDIYYIKVQSVANCGGSPCPSASISGRDYTIACETVLENSCSNGVTLNGNQSYNITNSIAADNSSSPNEEGIDCGYSIENNIMYQWCTDASNTPVSLDINNLVIEAGTSVQFSILSDDCGGNFTDIQCNSGIASDQLINITGTVASTCYWLSFDGNAGSVFTADITLIDAAVLPVRLLYFNGESNGSYNKLKWATATEINSSHFIIEKSKDFYDWVVVGEIGSVGNTSQTVHYYFNDYKISNNLSYYRLIQYDFDGRFEVLKIIAINNTDDFVERVLERVYDNFGRDITNNHNSYTGFKIYVYDDGYIEKGYK